MEINATARDFYLLSGTFLFLMWSAISLGLKEDFHRRIGRAVLAIRPTLIPAQALAFLLKTPTRFLSLSHGIVAANALAALFPEVLLLRLLAAILFTLYHCAECVMHQVYCKHVWLHILLHQHATLFVRTLKISLLPVSYFYCSISDANL